MLASRTNYDRHRKLLVHRSCGESVLVAVSPARMLLHESFSKYRPSTIIPLISSGRYGDFYLQSHLMTEPQRSHKSNRVISMFRLQSNRVVSTLFSFRKKLYCYRYATKSRTNLKNTIFQLSHI